MLRFKVGPFPVSVYPWFFLSAILLGAGYGFGWRMAAWIFVVFVSVLVHELGHAVVGRVFGGRPEIRLEAFGGVTFPQFRSPPRPGRQFVLSFAGPVAGLLLGLLAYGIVRVLPPERGSVSAFLMAQFVWVSIVWAAFNLLPILPLDGGNMMLAFIEGVRRKPSVALASWISLVMALVVAGAVTLAFGPDPFALLWLGLFALQNFQRARAAAAHERAAVAPAAVAEEDAVERGDVAAAMEDARSALQRRDFDSAIAALKSPRESAARASSVARSTSDLSKEAAGSPCDGSTPVAARARAMFWKAKSAHQARTMKSAPQKRSTEAARTTATAAEIQEASRTDGFLRSHSSTASIIWPPSSGSMGTRLKPAQTTLTRMNCDMVKAVGVPAAGGRARTTIQQSAPSTNPATGPARERMNCRPGPGRSRSCG